jgi:hypothetical protein
VALLAPVEALALAVCIVAEDDARPALAVDGNGPILESICARVVGSGDAGVENEGSRSGSLKGRGREDRDCQRQDGEDGLDGNHFEGLFCVMSCSGFGWRGDDDDDDVKLRDKDTRSGESFYTHRHLSSILSHEAQPEELVVQTAPILSAPNSYTDSALTTIRRRGTKFHVH